MDKNVKRISCKRCQQRKIRCSRILPCTNCSAASVKCEFRESDFKRPPVSREYVAALESRISSLEGLLAKLKEAGSQERNQMLDDVEINDYVPSFSGLLPEEEAALAEALTKASLQETTDGSMIYHGPTSIFQNDISDAQTTSSASRPSLFQDVKSDLTNQTIRLCIALFFFWEYPLFMFIDREAFITEFEENPVDGDFCSPPLIYATAALGAVMSTDPDIRAQAVTFAERSESMLMEGLNAPRPTSVQALLCLGYWEVGRANISKGWLFAGMAFRMGQDLGFQRDPTHWVWDSEGKPKSASPFAFDTEFRRRIYWGCFLSDKIFSLFLGRPTFMYENDADVNLSESLPLDPPIWENWLSSHDLGFLKCMNPAGPKLMPLFNQEIELARIIHDMLSTTFTPKKKKEQHTRRWTEISLNKLNGRLVAWHEALPADMRWKKWSTNKDILQPNVAILYVLYHTTRICLNLPFIASIGHMPSITEDTPENEKNPLAVSFRICRAGAQGIVDVVHRYKTQHTLNNAPLIFVGASILAMNVILVTARHERSPPSSLKNTQLPFLDNALLDLSSSWVLAGEARLKFRSVLNSRQQQQQQQQQQQHDNNNNTTNVVNHRQETPLDDDAEFPPSFQGVSTATAAAAAVPVMTAPALGGYPVIYPVATPETHVLRAPAPDGGGGGLGTTGGQHPSWEPMSVFDGEAAYWANIGDSFLADSDVGFFNGFSGFEWPDQPPIP